MACVLPANENTLSKRIRHWTLLALPLAPLALAMAAQPAIAQSATAQSSFIVTDIRVEGLQRIWNLFGSRPDRSHKAPVTQPQPAE